MIVLGVWIKKDKKKETANDSEVDSAFYSSSLRMSSPGFSRGGRVCLPCSPLMDCAEPLLPYFEPPPCALLFSQCGSAFLHQDAPAIRCKALVFCSCTLPCWLKKRQRVPAEGKRKTKGDVLLLLPWHYCEPATAIPREDKAICPRSSDEKSRCYLPYLFLSTY